MSSAPDGHSWTSIQSDVLARIRAREWQPGDRIPDEADLALHYGCARATVNRALQALAEAGYIDRKRKAGTRVALHPVRKATLEIPITRLEIEGLGMTYRHVLLEARHCAPTAEHQARLGLSADAAMIRLRALHNADGAPFLYEDRYVSLEATPAIAAADLTGISANEWLVQNASFTRGSFAFSATSASAMEAATLGCPEGTALVVVHRTTWDHERPITDVRLTYAPGYQLRSTI